VKYLIFSWYKLMVKNCLKIYIYSIIRYREMDEFDIEANATPNQPRSSVLISIWTGRRRHVQAQSTESATKYYCHVRLIFFNINWWCTQAYTDTQWQPDAFDASAWGFLGWEQLVCGIKNSWLPSEEHSKVILSISSATIASWSGRFRPDVKSKSPRGNKPQ
jgi:hypothetical protein